jgi:penicillin-insensitive murein endopeptidase
VALLVKKVHAEKAMRAFVPPGLLLALAAILSQPAAAAPAQTLFAAVDTPAPGEPRTHGGASAGCVAGALALPHEGPGWQVLRPARNRNWGHPDTVAFVARLGQSALVLGWPAMLVGDLGQPRGGPVSGHASHQSGLDADIWLRRPDRLLTAQELAEPSAVGMVAGDRVAPGREWTTAQAGLIRAAASDPAVDRIFVNAAIKAALCRDAGPADRPWLRRIRPWWGHDSHFHVRLACPSGDTACVPQAPLPPGDGCDETLAWWLSDEALNPSPPATPVQPRQPLTMADLPAACTAVLSAP